MNTSQEEELSARFDGLEVEKDQVREAVPQRSGKQPGRGSRFLRSCLFWSVGLLGIFALGIAATWVLQVRPRASQLTKIERENSTLQVQVNELQTQVEEMRPLEEENVKLEADVQAKAQALLIFGIIEDIYTAQLALVEKEIKDARAALTNVGDDLIRLESELSGAEREVVRDLSNRVELVLSEMERDPEAALQDLDIMLSTLITLKGSLVQE